MLGHVLLAYTQLQGVVPALSGFGAPGEDILGDGVAPHPLVEEPAHVGTQVLLDDSLEVPRRSPAAAILAIEVLHRPDEDIFVHGTEVDQKIAEHLQHPGTLVISHQGIVPEVQLFGTPSDPNRRCVVAARADFASPVFQMPEELLVVLEDELHVPEAGELREPFRQPDVPVTGRLDADAPPLVCHLMGAEDLVVAAVAHRLEGPHGQVHEAREGLPVRKRDLSRIVPIEQRGTVHAGEERETVRHVRAHLLLG